jgi:1,4-alpha-glucan branching enzyme
MHNQSQKIRIPNSLKFRIQIFTLLLFITFSACGSDDEVGAIDTIPPDTAYTQYGTPFSNIPQAADVVMYEVNLRAFDPANGISGVTDRLDHLESLGINVIWLMPIYPDGEINSVNSPYSVKDFMAVSTEYGTLEDLRTLTDNAHARGIAVILDWVANHTSWDNEWITNEDWYTQDASGNIVQPAGTNWQDVADLNFDNPEMRLAMIDAMKYWILEANVDGFRCDYADGVPFDFWQQAIDSLDNVPDRDYVLLAEGARTDHITAGFDLNFSWNYYGTLKEVFDGQSPANLIATHQNEYNNMPTGGQRLRFTTNHDESAWDATPITLYGGKEGALAASVITTFLGGAPLIYTGQEIGRSATLPFFTKSTLNWDQNPEMLQAYQQFMAFYGNNAVARKGSNTYYETENVMAFKKTLGDEEVLIIVNVRDQPQVYDIPADLQGSIWMDVFEEGAVNLDGSLELGGFEYAVLKKE